jgi:hypothetical protein
MSVRDGTDYLGSSTSVTRRAPGSAGYSPSRMAPTTRPENAGRKRSDVTNHEDPSWRPSLRVFRWYLVPFVRSVLHRRQRRMQANGLIALRSVFLSLVGVLFLLPVALSFIEPWDGGDERWIPWAVVVIGTIELAWVARVRRRPLATTSMETLARSYQALFFIGISIAVGPGLWGFAGAFLGGSFWIYLVGLAFALVGLWMIAPTHQDIERRQREITATGSPLSVLDALVSVPPALL